MSAKNIVEETANRRILSTHNPHNIADWIVLRSPMNTNKPLLEAENISNTSDDNTVTIVVVISSIVVLCVLVYIFYSRKRKKEKKTSEEATQRLVVKELNFDIYKD